MNIQEHNETICAISTPSGMGGIAVIRISGNNTFSIIQKCWQGASIEQMASHTAHLGNIIDSDDSILDQVVLTIFRAPNSFTGENVAEISCHGSIWIQQQIINRLITCGCRIASAGEFTQRAFSSGRIDLSQAEAIADLIAASSKAAHEIAIKQMRGSFKQEINNLRQQLIDFSSLIELELDFSEEDVTFADRQNLLNLANHIHQIISRLADSFHKGNAIKNGIPVAIVGETNAGKSTLLNYLIGDERAIVSDIHGTTRDVIEDTITINGTLFRFIDTAGIRNTADPIEKLGIERTFSKIRQATIIIWVVDGTSTTQQIAQTAQNILPDLEQKHIIAAINKADLLTPEQQTEVLQTINQAIPQAQTILISALTHLNLTTLSDMLTQFTKSIAVSDETIVTNARHYQALTLAQEAIQRVIDGIQADISGDFLSQDIRECIYHLATITGDITTTDILTTIFSRFCIGK